MAGLALKYRDMPTLVFKKGTSKKIRRLATFVLRSQCEQYWPDIQKVASEAVLYEMVHGHASVAVTWDGDAPEFRVAD